MNNFEDHLLPLYVKRETDPPAPRDVGVDYVSSVAKSEAIVRIVNTVRDVGLENLITALSRLITPLTVIYETIKTPEATRVLTGMGTQYYMVWMKASELVSFPIPNAKYAIAFTIDIAYPFQALGLAYLLLRFSEKYTFRGKDDFQMVNLCYKLTPRGVYGALFYDANIAVIHNSVQRSARAGKDEFFGVYKERRSKKYAVESWNMSYDRLAHDKDIHAHIEETLSKIRHIPFSSVSPTQLTPSILGTWPP
ncbi:hypothetical protein EST38_g9714 [Candolleomyces aberdarensis]|uniref:Uncharacterized protein n=1 Tax=Candolleomyces aberdarensis TaxID=2316362 RepID=A0A4Q2D986_9AGAR|nr:hypothetical protein EST38_g9714 [Candolleomyces aberdarensis]